MIVPEIPDTPRTRGLWNATTNTPTLINGVGLQGDSYLVNVAGTWDFGAGAQTFNYNELVVYNGDNQWVPFAFTLNLRIVQ